MRFKTENDVLAAQKYFDLFGFGGPMMLANEILAGKKVVSCFDILHYEAKLCTDWAHFLDV